MPNDSLNRAIVPTLKINVQMVRMGPAGPEGVINAEYEASTEGPDDTIKIIQQFRAAFQPEPGRGAGVVIPMMPGDPRLPRA